MTRAILGVLMLAVCALAAERHVVVVSVDGLAASYFDDPRAPMPFLRQLARQGAHAGGMISAFPSLTWPTHTSLITGVSPRRHGIIGNSVLDRKSGRIVTYVGDPEFTKEECVRAPTIYDAVHKAGLRTAGVIWPATVGAPTLGWAIPDTDEEKILARYTTPGLAEELASAGISIQKLAAWGWKKEYSAVRDFTYTRVALHLVIQHRPSLTLLHLITPDGVQHNYGPHTEEAYWAVSYADERIRELWEGIQNSPLAGQVALFIVSDHGFAAYDKVIYPNVLLRQLGLVETDGSGKVSRRKAWFHSSCGGVYVLDQANRAGLVTMLKKRLTAQEGVDRVFSPEDFQRIGVPDLAGHPYQPDLLLAPKPGYSFANEAGGAEAVVALGETRGNHGHWPELKCAHATFIASGAGIRRGVALKTVSALDVAPTVGAVLGVKMPGVEGRVLEEILEPGDGRGSAGGPRLLILTDMEGVGGINSWEEQTEPGQRRWEEARRLLTGEVNAAVVGAFDAGASQVVVLDGHDGSRTLSIDEIDPRAELIQGPRTPATYYLGPKLYDGILFVGQHAMAGAKNALLAHTQSRGVERVTINGRPVGELGQTAAIAGHFDIPVIFLSGDQAACDEMLEFQPQAETVAVKRLAGRASALSLPHTRARELIRIHARRAVERTRQFTPWKIAGPVEMRFEYKPPRDPRAKPRPPNVYQGATVLEAFEQWLGK